MLGCIRKIAISFSKPLFLKNYKIDGGPSEQQTERAYLSKKCKKV